MMAPSRQNRKPMADMNMKAPFPYQQMLILALCRICEPIAFMSIFPYVYYMISSFQITKDERQISIYAGMVTSAFTLAEFSTGVIWGKLSDRIGRKPVLLTGLAGTGLSMLIFGFARSLPVALLARALGGILNGNIGVLQTTVAEIVKIKEHQPRAYAVMPFVWCLGSILGPALGGMLAEPCTSYPNWFARAGIFDRFPYLLPNLICVVIVIFGVITGFLFLEETHEQKKYQPDLGLVIGNRILRLFMRNPATEPKWPKSLDCPWEENSPLIVVDEQPPGYCTMEGSPKVSPPTAAPPILDHLSKLDASLPARKAPNLPKAFSRQIILLIVGYGILAFHTISFEQLMPVLLSMPESEQEPHLPFQFVGGFALPTKTIGLILALQGFYSMITQIFLFPAVVSRFGSLATFKFVALLYPLLYVATPYLTLLPRHLRIGGVLVCLMVKVTGSVLAYPAHAILLTNSAQSLLVLGTINGVAASTASLCRAIGPTFSGFIQSVGLKVGFSGLSWWACALVCVLGAIESFWLEEPQGRMNQSHLEHDNDLEEALLLPVGLKPILTTSVEEIAVEANTENSGGQGQNSKLGDCAPIYDSQ